MRPLRYFFGAVASCEGLEALPVNIGVDRFIFPAPKYSTGWHRQPMIYKGSAVSRRSDLSESINVVCVGFDVLLNV